MSKSGKFVLMGLLVLMLLVASVAPLAAQTIEPEPPGQGGTLIVYVMRDTDGVAGPDSNDTPVPNAKVLIGHGTDCTNVLSAYETLTKTTDADGKFSFENASDCYFVSVVDGKQRLDAAFPAPPKDFVSYNYVGFDPYTISIPTVKNN